MTSVLSGISGQFGKALVLGTFLPAVVFVILLRVLVQPIFPADWFVVESLKGLDTQWEVFALLFVAVVTSGLLYVFNIPLTRLFEGYPWRDSLVGSLLRRHGRSQLEADLRRRAVLPHLSHALQSGASDQLKSAATEVAGELGRVARRVDTIFPRKPNHVLPTRLGNTIRSFEGYPTHQYGMDAITLWPRLVGKLDQQYAAAVADAKMSFDFMINSAFLQAMLALMTLVGGLLYPERLAAQQLAGQSGPWLWLLQIAILLAVAYFLYCQSIARATEWGDMVKGAFDLYRWDLLRQLGYKQEPTTRAEEQSLWTGIGRRIMYGERPRYPDLPYADVDPPPLPSARARPDGVNRSSEVLEVSRGVRAGRTDGALTVILRLKNMDKEKRRVQRIEATDRVPEGFEFVWDSAWAEGRGVTVVGINPYQFRIAGTLDHRQDLRLTYRMVARRQSPAPTGNHPSRPGESGPSIV